MASVHAAARKPCAGPPRNVFYMAAAATTAFALDFNSEQIVDGIADYEPDAEPKQEEKEDKPVL